MSSFTTDVYGLLKHNEAGPLRHPLVVICHLPFAAALALVFLVLSDHTPAQLTYFTITIGLYLSSTAYHYWRPDALLRFCDQTMIGWYILATPLPFVYTEPWAIPLFVIMAATIVLIKWFKFEATDDVESWIFLGFGIMSAGLMFSFGLENIGVGFWSIEGLLVSAAIVCFIAKWFVYHFQTSLIKCFPEVWEAPEEGHCYLSWGVSILTYLVVMRPVLM